VRASTLARLVTMKCVGGGAIRLTWLAGDFLNILPALKKGRGFLRSLVWFQPEHFRRVPVSSLGLTAPHLRRLHIGPARP